MDIRRSLSTFRLNGPIPVEQLNSLFRELVKKYHPDKVRDYPDWAHERMSEINEAYETIVEWLENPPAESEENEISENHEENHSYEVAPSSTHSEGMPLPTALESRLRSAFNKFLDGLGTYYQYGLEKHEHRQEGIRRFRFREASRLIIEGRDELESLLKGYRHPILKIVARFARLTTADIGLSKAKFHYNKFFRKIDMRLDSARRDFDDAIKEILFPEFIPNHLRGRATSKLYTCYAVFALYMIIFNKGERHKFGVLMADRYDALMDLMELKNCGLLPP